MGKLILRSSLYVVVLTVLLGGIYPALVYAAGQLLCREKANGSFVRRGGRGGGAGMGGSKFPNTQETQFRPPRPRETRTPPPPPPPAAQDEARPAAPQSH